MAAINPRILILGAGSRGHSYAKPIVACTPGRIVGIAEPIEWKRLNFAKFFGIDVNGGLVFDSWQQAIASGRVAEEVDGVAVCTLDETHVEIVAAFRPLNVHILCEKPLATTLASTRSMLRTVQTGGTSPILFAVGHVLRYSPHNILLHRLLVSQKIVGDIVNINHTEPVGYWHFAHSYVRGNWRDGSVAPSLLTKCCHDVDLLLWLVGGNVPARVSSHGSLVGFRKSMKPEKAGSATNCYSCPASEECIYAAQRIYTKKAANKGWPNKIVAPDIEDAANTADAAAILEAELRKEGTGSYGRCVYEADNDVVDNQVVILDWDDSPGTNRGAKTATLTMIAYTQHICDRYTKVYGTKGEVTADSNTVSVFDFATETTTVYRPEDEFDASDGHGGGDTGLARAWVTAMVEVLGGKMSVEEAQRVHIKCTPEEAVRGHEVVWWAEEARRGRKTVELGEWEKAGEGGELVGH